MTLFKPIRIACVLLIAATAFSGTFARSQDESQKPAIKGSSRTQPRKPPPQAKQTTPRKQESFDEELRRYQDQGLFYDKEDKQQYVSQYLAHSHSKEWQQFVRRAWPHQKAEKTHRLIAVKLFHEGRLSDSSREFNAALYEMRACNDVAKDTIFKNYASDYYLVLGNKESETPSKILLAECNATLGEYEISLEKIDAQFKWCLAALKIEENEPKTFNKRNIYRKNGDYEDCAWSSIYYNVKAFALGAQGRYDEAETYYQRAAGGARKDLRQPFYPDHRVSVLTRDRLVRSLVGLANIQIAKGNLKEAARTLDEADNEIRREKGGFGPGCDVARLTTLGRLRLCQGRFEDAKSSYQAALDLLERERRHEHRFSGYDLGGSNSYHGVLMLIYNWNYVDNLGKFALEADTLEKQGRDYLFAAFDWDGLGELALIDGDWKKAESCFSRALHIRRASLPEGHRDLAYSLSGLGRVAAARPVGRSQGTFRRGRKDFEESPETRPSRSGPTGGTTSRGSCRQKAQSRFERPRSLRGQPHPSRTRLGLSLPTFRSRRSRREETAAAGQSEKMRSRSDVRRVPTRMLCHRCGSAVLLADRLSKRGWRSHPLAGVCRWRFGR